MHRCALIHAAVPDSCAYDQKTRADLCGSPMPTIRRSLLIHAAVQCLRLEEAC